MSKIQNQSWLNYSEEPNQAGENFNWTGFLQSSLVWFGSEMQFWENKGSAKSQEMQWEL